MTIVLGLGVGPHYNSFGQLAVNNQEFNRLYRNVDGIDGVRTIQANLVSERTYHQPRLKAAALKFILNDLSPKVKARLDGL